jgi:PEP-CTERM motif
VEITAGTQLEDLGYAFADLSTPVLLSPGNLYFITAMWQYNDGSGTSSSYERYNQNNYTIGSGVTLFDPTASSGANTAAFNNWINPPGVYPNNIASADDNTGPITMGGNFIYEAVPEPTSVSLIALSSAGLLVRRRRGT